MTLDPISLHAGDLERSRAFHVPALAPLGTSILIEGHGFVGFGMDRKPQFRMGPGGARSGAMPAAFVAATRAEVRACHSAALAAGGTDNGASGRRPHDHPNAFVFDPDGNNAEPICHLAED